MTTDSETTSLIQRSSSSRDDRRESYGSQTLVNLGQGQRQGHPEFSRNMSISNTTQPITLSWRGVNAYVKPKQQKWCNKSDNVNNTPRQILKNVNGVVKPGTLLAILGASGAGKSTLLNVLTQRNTKALIVEGDIALNGSKVTQNTMASLSAYVQQDDIFIGLLKVKEHLWFQSMLRMDRGVPDSVREYRVEEVIEKLGLSQCQDNIIGSATISKSISGGERKRLAFASEVLMNPSLMFCDEPTSGLDSFMAENVVSTLKDLVNTGKTIVCTIHQPSSEVYALFDNLLLLADGQVAYMGAASKAAEFFSNSGYTCPPAYNPADFFIHTLAIVPKKEAQCRDTIQSITAAYQQTTQFTEMIEELNGIDSESLNAGVEVKSVSSPYKTPWSRQFSVVLWRSWTTTIREPMATRVKLGQALFVALLLGLIFFQQKYNQKGVMNINGVLFILETQVSFGNMFSVITTFPLEFPVFLREHRNGMYRVDVYYITKILAEFPIFLLVPALFSTVSYWMIGLYPHWQEYLICTGILILVTNVATSYAYMVGSSTSSVTVATALLPSVVIPLMLFGGFFLNSGSVPVYFVWLQYLSWFNYCNEILVINQWQNVKNITCEYANSTLLGDGHSTSRCFTSGPEVIESLSFHKDNVMTDLYALIALFVGFRILSFIIMLIRSYSKD